MSSNYRKMRKARAKRSGDVDYMDYSIGIPSSIAEPLVGALFEVTCSDDGILLRPVAKRKQVRESSLDESAVRLAQQLSGGDTP